ncbi:MAG: SRPBCC family protein [Thermoleophilaceae bacterium]|nr:SRPBCC family protein [Thermoleophilaceae bacterium]
MEVSASAVIAAPQERVWEVLGDTGRYAEWVAGTDEATRTDGPARPGSTCGHQVELAEVRVERDQLDPGEGPLVRHERHPLLDAVRSPD